MSSAWPEPDRAVFSISVAAELSGLHAQTLRVYEREGLLEPARTPGGTRRYSGKEIDRLREIAALVEEGVNIAGMRRVLNLEQRIRNLQAEVSGFEASKQETRRLKAELALARGEQARKPRKRRPKPA